MRVITLDDNNLQERCRELRNLFENTCGNPELTIGIARGGLVVAGYFSRQEPLSEIRLQRASTRLKDTSLHKVIRALPRPAANLLRMIESLFHGMIKRRNQETLNPVAIHEALRDRLASLPQGAVVAIVDDAADSGSTLRRVSQGIKAFRSDLKVRSAVITVTRPEANDSADVAIWRDRTLVRFPWAPDFQA